MKISVDMDLCENHGQCVFAAPNVFSFDDDDQLVYVAEPDEDERERVLEAIDVCPVMAIRLESE